MAFRCDDAPKGSYNLPPPNFLTYINVYAGLPVRSAVMRRAASVAASMVPRVARMEA